MREAVWYHTLLLPVQTINVIIIRVNPRTNRERNTDCGDDILTPVKDPGPDPGFKEVLLVLLRMIPGSPRSPGSITPNIVVRARTVKSRHSLASGLFIAFISTRSGHSIANLTSSLQESLLRAS